MIAWLVLGIPAVSLCLLLLAWQLIGREDLLLRKDTLEYRWAIGPLGRTRTFTLHSIENLRGTSQSVRSYGFRRHWMPPVWAMDLGGLAFDHEGRTLVLGRSLDERQGRELAEILRQRGREPA